MTISHGRKRSVAANVMSHSKMPIKRAYPNTVSRRVYGHAQKTPSRAGLYARVSTHDQQTLKLQNRAMRDYASRRGWVIAIELNAKQVRKLFRAGVSKAAIARQLQLGRTSVRRILTSRR